MFNFDPQAIDLYHRKIVVDAVCLDCESPETARDSIAKILQLSPNRLVQFLRDFNFEEMPDNFGLRSENQGELILKTILFNLHCRWGFSHCSWFHLSRCRPTESFQEGLLPAPDVIDKMWAFLFEINSRGLSKPEWNTFKRRFESFRLCHSRPEMQDYHDRITVRHHQGPNGVLIGDLNVVISLGQTGFLKTPEIINSICTAFHNEFRHPLNDDFLKATRPCVIKFMTTCNNPRYLSKALVYLYETQKSNPEFVEYLDCSYIGNGTAIYPWQIQKRTFLDNGDI